MEQSWPGLGYHIGTEHSARDVATTGPLLGQSKSIIQFSKLRINCHRQGHHISPAPT
jgi:hypothetical protein